MSRRDDEKIRDFFTVLGERLFSEQKKKNNRVDIARVKLATVKIDVTQAARTIFV